MLTIVYGGTFDPIHNGHLALAEVAAAQLHGEVRLLPAADPPHRPTPGADAGHRAAMVALAIEGRPLLRLDRREIERPGRSYMVDTLVSFREELGDGMPLALLLGADAFHGLPRWRLWRELFALAHLVVAPRRGWSLEQLPPELAEECEGRWCQQPHPLRELPAGRLYRLDLPSLREESASELRQRLALNGEWPAMVPAPVAEYIRRHGLYRSEPGP